MLQSALARTVGSWPAVFCQGAVFGLAYVGGFPSGVVGVVLAGFYGVALGILRQRSGGLLAPWAAHVVADLAISSMVVIYVL